MKNKGLKIAYWVILAFLTIGMLASAVPSVLKLPYAVAHFCNVLKLPEYLLVFTGILKIAGLIVLYIPKFPKLKEWVFAGFVFDLAGAWYCNTTATNSFAAGIPVLLYLATLLTFYYLYNKLKIATA
jgi:hypothetical protein